MRVAFAGFGAAASSLHLPAMRRLREAVLVGASDVAADRRAEWERLTGTPAFHELRDLLEQAQPEVVVVATPPDSHADLAIEALQQGAHVVCEKPFAASPEEADRVLSAAAAAGRRVAVNHHMRHTQVFTVLRQQIESGDVGRLVFCQINQLMDFAPWDDQRHWRAAMPESTLFEGGVHLVDLMLFLHGRMPVAVFARRSSGVDGAPGSDAIHLVTFEFSEGLLAQLTLHRLCRGGTRYVEVRADCEHASLRASIGGRALLTVGKKRAHRAGVHIDRAAGGVAWMEQGLKRTTLARNPRPPEVRATAELLAGAVAAFAEDREPPVSGRQARDGLAVLEAIYRSSRTGARVELRE